MIKFILKLMLAFFLVFWLLKSGKMDLSLLVESLQNKQAWFFCFLILLVNIMLITLRWKKLLELKAETPFAFLSVLRLTWIGNLFNTVLPGAVSGDIIKLVYARDLNKNLSKTYLITTVIMDRVIGLFGLLILLGVFSLINYKTLSGLSQEVAHLVHFNFLITLITLVCFATIFLSGKKQGQILSLVKIIPLAGPLIHKPLSRIWSLGKYKGTISGLILLSVFTHALNILAFWFLASPYMKYAPHLIGGLTLSTAFTFIPLGFLTLSIPITPAGIGVGHAAFSTLFSYFGVVNGASLFNFYFLGMVTVNLLGIFPYLGGGVRHTTREAVEFETA